MPPETLTPPEPQPLSEAQVLRSMRWNIGAGFLGMVWVAAATGMALPLFMQSIQASGFQLGLLSGSRQLAMLAQLPGALLGERLPSRKPMWALCVSLHRALWAVPALLPWLLPSDQHLWPVWIIASLGLSELLSNSGTPLWYSWMADLLPPHRAGSFWGRRHRILSISLLIASLLFAAALEFHSQHGHLGFQLIFATAALFGVADILVHLGVHEPAPRRSASGTGLWKRITAPLASREFRILTAAMGIWAAATTLPGYTNGLPSFFAVVYLRETFHASYLQASSIFIASALGAILFAPKIGAWIDHHGARKTAAALMLIGPLLSLAWIGARPAQMHLGLASLPHPILLLALASLGVGGAFAGVIFCQARLTQQFTDNSGRTIAMGLHWSLVGLMGTAAALLAGWIKDHPHSLTWLLPDSISYFQFLVLLEVALIWCIALPLLLRLPD